MDLSHALVALAGLVLLGFYFRSISVAALLAQRRNDLVLRSISRAVRWALSRRSRRAAMQARMDWFMPLQVLLTVVVWFAWLTLAFACLYWASGATHGAMDALVASGSALSTLGFFTPDNLTGRWLAIAEGMLGLVAVVYLFTFVPGFLSTLQTRSQHVGWVAARSGHPPRVPVLLAEELDAANTELWSRSEDWFRLLSVTHPTAPELAFMPSFLRGQSWTHTAALVLESATIASLSLPDEQARPARICLSVGAHAMREIATALNLDTSKREDRDECVAVLNTWISELRARHAGVATASEALASSWWRTRSEWAPALAAIAEATGSSFEPGLCHWANGRHQSEPDSSRI